MLIGISGKSGSGKDTTGQIISNLIEYEIKKFADSLKDMVCILINCNRDQLENREFKEKKLEKFGLDLTPREILQILGDTIRNEIHSDMWINSLYSNYGLCNEWVITDVRYPNEADFIKNKGGIVIRINRPDITKKGKLHEHISETALDHYQFNYVIENDGDLKELEEKIKVILNEFVV